MQGGAMIVRVGIDVVEVERIARAMRSPGFLKRILTPCERETITTPLRVAGRWAAKEAIAKAVGVGLTWQDVEILNDPSGEPVATVRHALFEAAGHRLHLSISHEKGIAAAVAVLERIELPQI
jgi:holo-[acyl-carrier protein] synthase